MSCKKSVELLPHEISCTQCRKTFSTQKALSRHTKVHSKDKPDISNTASCVVCQKTFAKSYNLKRHQQAAHGLTEKGNVVQNSLGLAVFTTEALVKERVIQKVHAPASVQCNQCNYKAKTKWLLKRHVSKVKDIPESTHNLRIIFDEIKINEVSRKYKMIGDLKVYSTTYYWECSQVVHSTHAHMGCVTRLQVLEKARMHLKRLMAILSVKERCKQKSQLKNSKE